MPVNLPLLYEQLRAGIRNEVDGFARRLKPVVLMRTGNVMETRFNGLSQGDKKQMNRKIPAAILVSVGLGLFWQALAQSVDCQTLCREKYVQCRASADKS